MKYPYSVIANGKWYEAGEEIPDLDTTVEELHDTALDEVEVDNLATAEEVALSEEPQYSKTQISKLNKEQTKALAIELGFESGAVEELSANELKRNIISFLKL